MEQTQELVERRIIHLLKIYPGISPTMLQAALGPKTKPQTWRPALKRLLEQGVVEQEFVVAESPMERYNTYTKLAINGVQHSYNSN